MGFKWSVWDQIICLFCHELPILSMRVFVFCILHHSASIVGQHFVACWCTARKTQPLDKRIQRIECWFYFYFFPCDVWYYSESWRLPAGTGNWERGHEPKEPVKSLQASPGGGRGRRPRNVTLRCQKITGPARQEAARHSTSCKRYFPTGSSWTSNSHSLPPKKKHAPKDSVKPFQSWKCDLEA